MLAHKTIFKTLLLIFLSIFFTACNQKKDLWLAEAPAGSEYAKIDLNGKTIIPNGRIISPVGNTIRIAPHPYGLCLSPNGKIAVTANSGNRPFSISIIKDLYSEIPEVKQVPEGALNEEDLLGAVFMGLAISPDNKYVYVSGGQENMIYAFDLNTGEKSFEIDCALIEGDRDYTDGYIGDMCLSKDGKTLYAVDQIGFRVIVIDLEGRKILQNLPSGRYPFGITLSPDEKQLYVANVGVFEYKPFNNLDPDNLKESALDYPAFEYNSKEMKEGIENDSMSVPALGDPNVPESFSVWTYALGEEISIKAKTKTGILVGEMIEGIPAVGGSSPNSLVATEKYVFVSNGNNDCISIIDVEKDTIVQNLFLSPDERLNQLRGMIPFGLAISPDQQRLFVAESGLNSVGVIDIPSLKVIGHIPVGWFPSKLAVSPDGKHLIVANAKGYGSGPNGGPDFELGPEGTYIGHLMKGSVSIIDMPDDQELDSLTQIVIENAFAFKKTTEAEFTSRANNPIPLYPGEKESPIKYLVFISKENRTYDEVFGQLEKGKGEASLARYGRNQSFSNIKGTDSVQGADIMVNHHALARRFAISDNFYVASDHSADGHRWLVNTYPNEWMETSVAASYGGKRRAKTDSKAPGNLALYGASGAIYPEDYNEHGSMWEHLERHKIDFFNFGFGLEMSGTIADSTMKYTGVKYLVNFPVPGPLYDRSSRSYPTYNMAIPDQFRVDQFLKEYKEKWEGEGKDLPSVLTILLPNDHGAGDRPHAGYPFRESYMMDNDLALGRLVEFLSQTPYWKEMAIIVTEDDSQNGQDHIDAHRSLLMLISPWAKKDYISHNNYSFGSIFKTFWHVLGIPYLNQYDAGATDMADMFADEPDFTPYFAYPVDPRAFDPQKVLDPFDENFDWKAVINSPNLDDPEDLIKEAAEVDAKLKENK
ncbi:MAG: hypothetical protein AAFR87_31975 [Bacteroidota bacterium]